MKHKYSVKVDGLFRTPDSDHFYTKAVEKIVLDFGGIPGDRHYGMTRISGGRERYLPRGTELRNRRQLSLVSIEEMRPLAERLGVDYTPLPGQIGANILLSGMDNLTKLPAGALLMFETGAVLHCEGENHPCRFPGEFIESQYKHVTGMVTTFAREATGCRGLVASVERLGEIQIGETVKILLP